MEKVQNLKSSNTAPSSKTFRDETYMNATDGCVHPYVEGEVTDKTEES
jgi:hypothetical protein